MARIEGLDQLQRNIDRFSRRTLPQIQVKAINKIARRIGKDAVKSVAKEIGVPMKTIKGRLRTEKAKRNNPVARLRVNRMNMPAVRLFERKSNRLRVSRGVISVGKYRFQRGFVQTLKNGRKHIIQRRGRKRYSIDVVKIPLSQPLTNAFRQETARYPEEMRATLNKLLSEQLSR